MKYRIEIPPPKAKRMVGRGVIVLTTSLGQVENKKKYKIDQNFFEFDMPEDVPYIYETRTIDGSWFNVEVLYSNADQTRSESIQVVPEKIHAR